MLPFGLSNAAQMQQLLMDTVFRPELEANIFTNLDDIIVVSSTSDQHIKLLCEVLKTFCGLVFFVTSLNFEFFYFNVTDNSSFKNHKKGSKISWNEKTEEAFCQIKQALVSAPILSCPEFRNVFV